MKDIKFENLRLLLEKNKKMENTQLCFYVENGELEQCVKDEDYVRYKEIVDNCEEFNVEGDFWRELFYDGDEKEINFWLDYPRYIPDIGDLILIKQNNDNLFIKALNSNKICWDSVDGAIEYLKEIIEGAKNIKEKVFNEQRLKLLASHIPRE
jgi:hypothetical protein